MMNVMPDISNLVEESPMVPMTLPNDLSYADNNKGDSILGSPVQDPGNSKTDQTEPSVD